MKPRIVRFYEVLDHKGVVEWGGVSEREAIEWFRRGLDRSIYVSVWDESNELDFKLITEKIDVTKLVLATLTADLERESKPKKVWR
jgi:hypothetical protein